MIQFLIDSAPFIGFIVAYQCLCSLRARDLTEDEFRAKMVACNLMKVRVDFLRCSGYTRKAATEKAIAEGYTSSQEP